MGSSVPIPHDPGAHDQKTELLGESSFNMTSGGDEDIEGGLRKFLDTRRRGSEKIVALGGGAPKI